MRNEPIEYEEDVDREVLLVAPAEHPGPTGAGALLMTLGWLVGIAGVVVAALLGFRLGFEMGEANATNTFVDFIYDVTGPLVQPFEGIAEARQLDSGGVFHPETAIAIGAYLVATALIMAVLYAWAGFFDSSNGRSIVERGRAVRGH